MGSVVVIQYSFSESLPAGLADAGNLAVESHLAETNPAETELSVKGARATANAASIMLTRFELQRSL